MRGAIAVALGSVIVFGLWLWADQSAEVRDRESISVFGPWLGSDADAFVESVAGFTDDTGIEVRYTGSGNFSTSLRERLERGAGAPDIAVIPQPGLVADLIDNGQLVPLSGDARAAIEEHMPDAPIDVPGGASFVLPYRTIVKSLVWYRPDVFESQGWTVPDTLGELTDLVENIQDSTGMSPWCFGIYSGDDTGWPATDWVEDLLLRRGGVDVYDEWVSGVRGFDDPGVAAAFAEFSDLVLARRRAAGGLETVLDTELREIDDPLFAEEPGCSMYKQASFGMIWFPEGTQIGPDGDVDFFVLPPATANAPAPLLRSGDSVVQLSDRPEVGQLMAYLASPEGAAKWAGRGGYISGRSSVDLDSYYTPEDRRIAELLLEDRESRFDASDQLPSGQRDLLFSDVTAWIAGAISYEDLAADLDAARNPAG